MNWRVMQDQADQLKRLYYQDYRIFQFRLCHLAILPATEVVALFMKHHKLGNL